MLAMQHPHVLDSILDELDSSNAKDNRDMASNNTVKNVPKPPERKRYNTSEAIKVYFNEKSLPPNPIRQTNALDSSSNVDNISRITVASTASTESVNSQEGIKDRLPFNPIGS
uniref:Uncharacterized protein n=1 Tax=Ditylenchus dipsaci TaxID=166011 RepID=A0A915EDS5_9BILA